MTAMARAAFDVDASVAAGADWTYQAETHSRVNPIGDDAAATADGKPPRNAEHSDMQTVIVHYTVPAGQKFLPIYINEAVTMIEVGIDNGFRVHEPTSTFLKSPEAGLRVCQSMNINDPFHGPTELVPWGTSLVGPLSDDEQWIVNPVVIKDDHGEA